MDSHNICFLAAVLLCGMMFADGFSRFRDSIPNGHNVPHPCKAGVIWPGVGHEAVGGGGARNPFGKAFKAADELWTTELCNQDSDGDGRTNGQELGDPQCVFTKGGTPAETTGITHPGVCEPVDGSLCKEINSWFDTSTCQAGGSGSSHLSSASLIILLIIFSGLFLR